MKSRSWFIAAVLAGSASCHDGEASSADAGIDEAGDGGGDGGPYVPWFREVSSDLSGFAVTHAPDLNLPFSGGIGMAVGDIDGDGRPDLVAPSGLGVTSVFRNLGGWRFADITAASGVDGRGVANGASLCDIDGDGDLDLFLSTDEPGPATLFFFRNAGAGAFADETSSAGFASTSSVTSVLCTDLDGDGLLDVYVTAYGFVGQTGFPGRKDAFYRNRGDGTFVDLAARLGFDADGLTWAVAAYDYDLDGDLDLYVANDTFEEDDGTRPLPAPLVLPGTTAPAPGDRLFRNDGPGPDGYPVFTDVTAAAGAGVAAPRSTMGILAEDLTGDGLPDYYLSNYGRKALLAGTTQGGFEDRTADFDLAATFGTGDAPPTDQTNLLVSWGSALADFDLDGLRDVVLVNGSLHGEQQPVCVWQGGAGPTYAPVQTDLPPMVGRAVVAADLDGDGDPDLAVTNWRGSTRLFEDIAAKPGSAGAGWLAVVLTATTSAPEGRGARVTVGGVTRTLGIGGILDSSAPAEARFGLGAQTTATVEVLWPSGFTSHMGSVPANGVVRVTEPPLLAVTPRFAPADGHATASVVVKPAKADGTSLGPGAAVTIDASAGTWPAPTVDAGDGSYTRTLVAPSTPVLAVVKVTVNGAPITVYPRIEFR